MKISSKILFASMALSLCAGIATGTSVSQKNDEPQVAEAAGYTVRFTKTVDWWDPYVYAYNSESDKNANWPGWQMTYSYQNESNQAVYEATFSKDYKYIIFSQAGYNQLATIDTTVVTNRGFYRTGDGTYGSYSLTSKYYLYDYDNAFSGNAYCYAWNEYTSSVGNNGWPGVAMTKETSYAGNGRIYSVDLDVKYNSVIFSQNGSKQTSNICPSNGNAPKNLEAWAMGVGASEKPNTWWEDINYVFAHNFYKNIMDFRTTGTDVQTDTHHCTTGNYYSIAKATYTNIRSNQYILGHVTTSFGDAIPRLEKWAIANGETLNTSTGQFAKNGRVMMDIVDMGEDQSKFILLLASALSLIALGGFFFLKKKRA